MLPKDSCSRPPVLLHGQTEKANVRFTSLRQSQPTFAGPTSSVSTILAPTDMQRPNVKDILEQEIAATDYSEYFALGTSGPTSTTQNLANAVSDAIRTDAVLRGEYRAFRQLSLRFFLLLRLIVNVFMCIVSVRLLILIASTRL